MHDNNSLVDQLRQAGASPNAASAGVDDALRRATRQMLGAAFPLDVHHRYAGVKSRQLAAIERTTEKFNHTLTSLKPGDDVLSGKVAEAVKEGIAKLALHKDYTGGVGSIG